MKITVATSQFPVTADISSNCRHVLRQMRQAKKQGADVVHFCECALSGYASANFKSYKGFDWELLKESTLAIMDLARELKLWVVLGSSHPLTGKHKPHNSVYIINDHGQIVDRYDKRFCAGPRENAGELAHYTPGDHPTVFEIKGVRCGVIICHEFRYPELYRQYKKLGVQLMFHSYHAASASPKRLKELANDVGRENHKLNAYHSIAGLTMNATMPSYAANNYLWISCANSSDRESLWASFMARPDGVITGRLRRNVAGLLITTIDTRQKFYDSTAAWRDRAIKGIFHSGTLVKDARSTKRKGL